jgi:hypothetical protein
MTANKGTIISSPIRPATTADTYPTAYADELLGGYHSVASIAERNAIPYARRKLGMQCIVIANKVYSKYTLINNPTTDATQDSDWNQDIFSASDIKLSDGTTTIESELETNNTLASNKYIQFSIATNSVNGNDDEFVSPFNATIKAISISVPISTILSSDITAQLEKYDGTQWISIQQISIPLASASKSNSATLNNPYSLSINDRIRFNITKIQLDIVVLNATISIVLTK